MIRNIAPLAVAIAIAAMPIGTPQRDFEPVATITGHARAVDGDDIAFGRVRVRLWGIAAPGDGRWLEPGGPEATTALAALIGRAVVTCELTGETAGRSARPVAQCSVRGRDLAEIMVFAGLVRDCPAHSGQRYADAERLAKAAGRDLSAIYDLPDYCLQ